MMRIVWIIVWLGSSVAVASDMTVDQAVSRLLKDLDQVELQTIQVPVPSAEMPTAGASNRQAQSLPANMQVQTKGSHRVRRGETLDRVIRRLVPNSPLQRNVLRSAFVKANPHAFRRNNPNWMYAGTVLQIPDVEHLRQVIFKDTPGDLKKDISDEKADWVRFP
jgi:hypothetical protein